MGQDSWCGTAARAGAARLKEWAYAGFAITLGSALIAHVSVGDGPEAWGWAAATSVLWALSYFSWHRVQALPRAAQSNF